MQLTLDKTHLSQVEERIAPPMRHAITIPVHVLRHPKPVGLTPNADGDVQIGVTIYVCASPFATPINPDLQNRAIETIAKSLQLACYGVANLKEF